jgi:hypothetical protein
MEKLLPKMLATSVIVKNLPKENYCPKGENSPNLVTLVLAIFWLCT